MDVKKISLLAFFFGLVSCGPAQDMPVYQSATVELLDSKDEKGFYLLPLKGEAFNGQKYWSGDYWALNKGNINLRWNSHIQDGRSYISPKREQLLLMMPEEISQLYPSEKFDLYLGRYEYPLTEEVYTRANRYALDWEGICNGWFNWNADCANDLNAGSFHIVMANKVGKRNESFMVDINRYKEVWNHPILSYASRVQAEAEAGPDSPAGTVKILDVRTKVSYVNESEANSWEPVRGTAAQSVTVREYRYYLFLNLKNDIIGGEWRSEDRPDFLWVMSPAPEFNGILSGLRTLLND